MYIEHQISSINQPWYHCIRDIQVLQLVPLNQAGPTNKTYIYAFYKSQALSPHPRTKRARQVKDMGMDVGMITGVACKKLSFDIWGIQYRLEQIQWYRFPRLLATMECTDEI